MLDKPHTADLQFREWQQDRVVDMDFVRVVPPLKWDFFAGKLRPLADDCAARVRERLFAGVVHSFHYVKAKGWMAKIFRTVRSAPDWMDCGLSPQEALADAFGPRDPGMAFAVYGSVGPVYAADWRDMLDLFRRGWLLHARDTFLLCAVGTRTVALVWEGYGPYIGDRGERSLTRR